jgi:hypothetical protein
VPSGIKEGLLQFSTYRSDAKGPGADSDHFNKFVQLLFMTVQAGFWYSGGMPDLIYQLFGFALQVLNKPTHQPSPSKNPGSFSFNIHVYQQGYFGTHENFYTLFV